MSELLDAALEYARRGWPVFPLVPKGKLPVIPSAHERGDPPCAAECGREGHGFYDATDDEAAICRWWARWPRANVGVRTGVAFDVVDIDGQEALDALNAYRAGRPTTWGPEVATGGGGWHLWHMPSGAGNRAALLGAHIDYRGVGGYVVAPPSVHPRGRRYVWAEDIGAGPDEPLEPLAAWLHQLVLPLRPAVHSPAPRCPSPSAGVARPVSSNYGRQALDAELGRVAMAAEGDRNHQLNRSSFALGQLVGARVLPADLVVAKLIDAAGRAGLTGREVEATIASGLRNGLRQPRQVAS